MASVKFEFCSNFCIIAFLFLIFSYLIVLLSVFSAEIQTFRSFESSQSKFTSEELDAYSSSLSDAYEKATLNPINAFYSIVSNRSCNTGDELLQLYSWNTQTICVCPYNSQFSAGACPDFTNKDCYTTGERQLSLYDWKGGLICVNRITDWYIKNSDSQCDSNYLSCSHNMCVKKNEDANITNLCPITRIAVSLNTTIKSVTNETYQFISNLSNGTKLFVSRDYDNDFIIDLQVEINGPPCIYQLESPIRNSFQLLKATPNGCSVYNSDKSIYTQVDSQNEWNLYLENQITKMTEDIANIQSFATNTAKLYSVVRTKTYCISQYNLLLKDPIIETLYNMRYGGDAIGIVLVLLALLLFFIHFFGMLNKRVIVESLILAFYMIAIIFVQGIICPISLSYVSKSIANNKYLHEMNLNNCFAFNGYNKMNLDLADNILINSSKVYGIIYAILYFSLVVFLSVILYLMDKIKFNYFFDEEAKGELEQINFMETCKINLDDIDCDCLL